MRRLLFMLLLASAAAQTNDDRTFGLMAIQKYRQAQEQEKQERTQMSAIWHEHLLLRAEKDKVIKHGSAFAYARQVTKTINMLTLNLEAQLNLITTQVTTYLQTSPSLEQVSMQRAACQTRAQKIKALLQLIAHKEMLFQHKRQSKLLFAEKKEAIKKLPLFKQFIETSYQYNQLKGSPSPSAQELQRLSTQIALVNAALRKQRAYQDYIKTMDTITALRTQERANLTQQDAAITAITESRFFNVPGDEDLGRLYQHENLERQLMIHNWQDRQNIFNESSSIEWHQQHEEYLDALLKQMYQQTNNQLAALAKQRDLIRTMLIGPQDLQPFLASLQSRESLLTQLTALLHKEVAQITSILNHQKVWNTYEATLKTTPPYQTHQQTIAILNHHLAQPRPSRWKLDQRRAYDQQKLTLQEAITAAFKDLQNNAVYQQSLEAERALHQEHRNRAALTKAQLKIIDELKRIPTFY